MLDAVEMHQQRARGVCALETSSTIIAYKYYNTV